jgi:hypothetical protein
LFISVIQKTPALVQFPFIDKRGTRLNLLLRRWLNSKPIMEPHVVQVASHPGRPQASRAESEQEEAAMSTIETNFLRMLAKLESSVQFLDQELDRLPSRRIESELNAANAFLSALWQKLKDDNIDPYRVYRALTEIERSLQSLQLRVDIRLSQPSFWDSLISAVNLATKFINLITSMCGIGPLIPRMLTLPNARSIALLECRSSLLDVNVDVNLG